MHRHQFSQSFWTLVNESLLPIEHAVENRTIRNTARRSRHAKCVWVLIPDRFVSVHKRVRCSHARTKDRRRIRNFLMAFSKSWIYNAPYIFTVLRRSFILMQHNSRTIVTQLIAKWLFHKSLKDWRHARIRLICFAFFLSISSL